MKYFESMKNIGVVAAPRGISVAIARYLKEHCEKELHVYFRFKGDMDVKKKEHSKLFDSIKVYNFDNEDLVCELPNEGEVINESIKWEKKIGSPITYTFHYERFLGKGYYLGCREYPESIYSNSSYLSRTRILHIANRRLNYWDNEIKKNNLDLIIGGPVEAHYAALANNIPYVMLQTSRYEDYWMWTNYLFNNSLVQKNFLAKKYLELDEINKFEIIERHAVGVGGPSHINDLGWLKSTKKIYNALFWGLAYRVRALLIWKKLPKKHQKFFKAVKLPLMEFVTYRRMTGKTVFKMKDLKGIKYISCPLHKEPETALQQASPEFFDQYSMIINISMNLPSDMILVLMEHPKSMGRRGVEWYKKVNDLHNVFFIDIRVDSHELIRESQAVAGITGTSMLEGLRFGIPAIIFSQHSQFSNIYGAYVVSNSCEIIQAIDECLAYDSNKIRESAMLFLSSIVGSSFDLKGAGALWFELVGNYDYDKEIMKDAISKLEEYISFSDHYEPICKNQKTSF
jgi:hypothetical protein